MKRKCDFLVFLRVQRSAFKEVASVSCQLPVGTGKAYQRSESQSQNRSQFPYLRFHCYLLFKCSSLASVSPVPEPQAVTDHARSAFGEGRAYRRFGVKTKSSLNFRTFVFFVTFCSNALRSLLLRLAFGGLLFFLTMLTTNTLQADPNNTETRLRELLRNTMLQLRAAEAERASLQNAQAESEKQKKELSDQVEALSKELKSVKESADQTIADLQTKNSQLEADLAQIKEVLGKWKESQKQAVDLAVSKEGQRAKLAADNILLQRRVDDYRAKNLALFKLGNDILDRYDKFGLGDALTAREPFTGLTRVKMQGLVQDYQDKLADQKIKP